MLFRAPAHEVAAQAREGSLPLHLREQFVQMYGYEPSTSETRGWERSIPVLSSVLLDAGLEQVDIMIEYGLPRTSKRADVILAGVHPESGQPSYVVIELKQWNSAEPENGEPLLCRIGPSTQIMLNPIEQVRRYCEYLVSFNGALTEHPERITGAAYLHNATEFGIAGLYEAGQSAYGRLFSAERRSEFIAFLKECLTPEAGAAAADALLTGKISPSKQLMAVAADEVREREQFVLLDEQRVAYGEVLHAVRRAQLSAHKEVVIVTGGPGTGKSAIALALLGEFHRRGLTALHATGSASFTRTMRKLAGARSREVQGLFRYFNSFISAERNSVDVLICDEAHRIRETSANRYTPASQRTGRPQVEELIDAARVPIFLLDELQVVRPGELGTVAMIRTAAEAKGLSCRVVSLDGNFRSGGSGAYLRWVTQLLDPPKYGPTGWRPDGLMEVRTADSPHELEAFLCQQQSYGYNARMTAGYCWPWSRAKPGEPLPTDVVIGDWARPWTVQGERSVMGAPPAALWATDPAGFGQVGLVYTAQGFEYDWSGVILGPDLVWRDGAWTVARAASKDPVFKRTDSEADVRRLILNTYKVLLTRGSVGAVIYSTDAETRSKLRELIRPPVTEAV
ncbi:DNA/RNA helicase domain-containing protein [Streptomyces sp. NPDC056149]|uniref:DNA/RNA helicase domain-containing protein n=1 Tax=Streptomyces sp. NPDC056149 TaxID=3345728 RepID=UPI0035E0CF92